MRTPRTAAFLLIVLAAFGCARAHAQAALLMEEPYGFFGALNPTGHNAVYFDRICAETPVTLRRCQPGEMGAVIARYQGIEGYDWVAIPLIPYLYSVESADQVPAHVDRQMVDRMRDRYREAHFESLGPDLHPGNFVRGGWKQLVGVAYERRIYAISFETTEAQDDALIARLNDASNHTHFNLLFSNCADFARQILNDYYPGTFHRSLFPDAGMTTPKQIAWKLVRYGHKHPDAQVAVFEIPQVPGYRRMSHSNKSIDESFVTTVYAIPITIANPYLAGGLLVDYLIRGRYHVIPKNHDVLGPQDLAILMRASTTASTTSSTTASATSSAPDPQPTLTATPAPVDNPAVTAVQATGSASASPTATPVVNQTESGLREVTTVQ
jgi:hypothetical protein